MSTADIPIKRKDNYRYRGIPEPVQTVESLQHTVEALKEVVEVLAGQRADKKGRAVTINDLYLSGGLVPTTDTSSPTVGGYSTTFDIVQYFQSLQNQILSLQEQADSHELLTWDDLLFPATAVNPPGQASDPVWDNIIPGWLFSSTKTEVLHIVAQVPHNWVEGSELRPHLHWTKTNNGGGDVYWQLEYAWSAIGEVITPFTTLSSPTPISATPDTDTENKQLVTAFPGIDGTGRQISDMLLMRLSRVGGNAADTYGADARLLEYDIHYLRFPLSSVNEYSRT